MYNGKDIKMKKILSLVFILILISAGTSACIDVKTPDDYYSDIPKTDNVTSNVTITINADDIEQGIILSNAVISIYEGDTVYDVLLRAAKKYELVLGTGGTADFIYVKSINGISEQQYGSLSGWTYKVNGKQPSVGCGTYVLQDGDSIEFIYMKEMKFE